MAVKIKAIDGQGNPYYREMIKDLDKAQKNGEIQGIALVTIEGDMIHCDWVNNQSITLTELLGAVTVLQQDLLDRIKG